MNARPYRKYIEFIALCLLAFGLLWWFGRNLDWREVGHRVSNANPYLLVIAVLVVCSTYIVRAFRWSTLLKPLSPARLPDLFAATTIGFSAVFLIGRAGEFVRPVVLPMRDPRVRPSASLVTILVERIYDMMAVALMFAINLIWFRPAVSFDVSFSRVRAAGFGMLVATILGVIFLAWYRTRSAWLIEILDRRVTRWRFIPRKLTNFVMRLLDQLSRALNVLVDARALAITIGWTAVLWFGIALANYLVMHAFGLHVGVSEALFILGWSLVGSLVPTPGGAAGAFHAATAAGFLFLGVEKELAAAVAIFLHLVDFGPSVLFGAFYVIRGDLSFSRLRTLVSPEDFENPVGEVQMR
ncbi:MAG TPA: lysylphosphatidylglycerol synthase transmembrane domain-containing protein [Pyrinomonadaceae bacterium]|nr:lysylphosphatidylglycerol synthase transmembrane domain-containing protein [Pyrinomonadaceae bacterium]